MVLRRQWLDEANLGRDRALRNIPPITSWTAHSSHTCMKYDPRQIGYFSDFGVGSLERNIKGYDKLLIQFMVRFMQAWACKWPHRSPSSETPPISAVSSFFSMVKMRIVDHIRYMIGNQISVKQMKVLILLIIDHEGAVVNVRNGSADDEKRQDSFRKFARFSLLEGDETVTRSRQTSGTSITSLPPSPIIFMPQLTQRTSAIENDMYI